MFAAIRTGAALAAIVVGVIGASSAPAATRKYTPRSVAVASALESDVLAHINAIRRSRGLRPLRMSAPLTRAANAHSAAMVRSGFFSHTSADGTSFSQRVRRYYPRRSGSWSVGENILWSSPDVDAAGAVRMWMNSPPHRRIILTAMWREVGLSAVHATSAPGVYGGRAVTVVTADFGAR